MRREVGSVIDLSQPVDVLLPMPAEDGQTFTWSFRVRSPEAVLRGEAGLTLRRAAAGVWRIGPDVEPTPELPEEDSAAEEEAQQRPAPLVCQLRHFAEPVGRLTRDCPYGGKSRLPLWLEVVPRAHPGAGWHVRVRTELTAQALEELMAWRGLVP